METCRACAKGKERRDRGVGKVFEWMVGEVIAEREGWGCKIHGVESEKGGAGADISKKCSGYW